MLFRNILLFVLGLKNYLRLISKVYISCISMGMWKKKYPELFYLDSIIKSGDTCIDIGANLGYYSSRMAKLVGTHGTVYAIEPIPMFGEIWLKNINPKVNPQVKLLPYALGAKSGIVQMGIPEKNGRVHHGMTKIVNLAVEKYVQYFDVEMRNPDELFADLKDLHFIKCDVEGYESVVLENFKTIISKFRPLVQTELNGNKNRKAVIGNFKSLGYKCAILENGSLKHISLNEAMTVSQDFYFLPK
jgi:FkbM family methyltransferase